MTSPAHKILPVCCAVRLREPAPAPGVLEAWGNHSRMWPQRQRLRVRWMGGTARQQKEAWQRFGQIALLVNLSFLQVSARTQSEIRVGFDPNGGHWSYVGRDALKIPQARQTMNLALRAGPWNGDSKEEWDRVTLHEVLHAIGLCHEHQHPQADIPWDEPKVIDYYRRTQGWSEAETRFQVLSRESMSKDFAGTRFDPGSIMEYPVPRELTRNGFSVGWNRRLSSSDVQFVRMLYPIAADA